VTAAVQRQARGLVPSMFCNALMLAPAWIARDAAVWRSSWSFKSYITVGSPAAFVIALGNNCAAEHPFRRIHVGTPALISWRSDSH
jgi:hypothetical protein